MDVKIDTRGMDEAIRRAGTEGSKLMDVLAEDYVNVVRLSFGTSPRGRTYGDHVASVPGYPPNIDTGNYVNSLRWERDGKFDREIYGADYGAILEDSAQLDRPHLNPAMREIEDTLDTVAPRYIKLG